MATHTTPKLLHRGDWFETSDKPGALAVCYCRVDDIWSLPERLQSICLTFSDQKIKGGVAIHFRRHGKRIHYSTNPPAEFGDPLMPGLDQWLQKYWPELSDGKAQKLWVKLEYVEDG